MQVSRAAVADFIRTKQLQPDTIPAVTELATKPMMGESIADIGCVALIDARSAVPAAHQRISDADADNELQNCDISCMQRRRLPCPPRADNIGAQALSAGGLNDNLAKRSRREIRGPRRGSFAQAVYHVGGNQLGPGWADRPRTRHHVSLRFPRLRGSELYRLYFRDRKSTRLNSSH